MLTKQKEMQMLAHLRQNCRITLTELSKKVGVPISTLFDKLQENLQKKVITKHAALFDFQKIGYPARATMLLRVDNTEKQKIADYLQKHANINSVYKINNGYDFLLECIFQDISELEQFSDNLETKFHIKVKETHYIVEDIKREGFLSETNDIPVLGVSAQ